MRTKKTREPRPTLDGAGKEVTAGMRVKPSGYALRPRLDDRAKWMSWSSQWASADEAYQREAARRGTVTAILEPKDRWGSVGLAVTWDDGRESRCLPYMVEVEVSAMNLHAVLGAVDADGGGDALCGAVGSYLANKPADVNCAKCRALLAVHPHDVAELSLGSILGGIDPRAGGR